VTPGFQNMTVYAALGYQMEEVVLSTAIPAPSYL